MAFRRFTIYAAFSFWQTLHDMAPVDRSLFFLVSIVRLWFSVIAQQRDYNFWLKDSLYLIRFSMAHSCCLMGSLVVPLCFQWN
jgi:hypothetical protein